MDIEAVLKQIYRLYGSLLINKYIIYMILLILFSRENLVKQKIYIYLIPFLYKSKASLLLVEDFKPAKRGIFLLIADIH